MASGAVEEKVASNIGVQGSNPGRYCPVCEIFRMAKTDDSYVKIPTKADQNDEKKRKGFDRFWRSKSDENRRFLMFKSEEFLNTGGYLADYFLPRWNNIQDYLSINPINLKVLDWETEKEMKALTSLIFLDTCIVNN